MKVIKQLLVIVLVSNTLVLFAQQKVAMQSNGVTTIFGGASPFITAYNAASNGDTLYLPGGNLVYPATIDKGLVIIGAGFYPDSTAATSPTVLSGNLSISENADRLHIEGIELTGSLSFNSNHKVDSVVIKRCKLGSITYYGDRTTACESNEITESIITGNINLANAKSGLISNCIIPSIILNGQEMGISNNIFLHNPGYLYSTHVFNSINTSLISNNIIYRSSPPYLQAYSESNTFTKNIFTMVPLVSPNTFTDNYNSVDITTVFVNQTGNLFDYSHDYHLVNPSMYLGTDGTQVGIYGGMHPHKEGAVPINPHFQLKNISSQTDSNGALNIQIQVEAQDN